jgi:hypothetical protein
LFSNICNYLKKDQNISTIISIILKSNKFTKPPETDPNPNPDPKPTAAIDSCYLLKTYLSSYLIIEKIESISWFFSNN